MASLSWSGKRLEAPSLGLSFCCMYYCVPMPQSHHMADVITRFVCLPHRCFRAEQTSPTSCSRIRASCRHHGPTAVAVTIFRETVEYLMEMEPSIAVTPDWDRRRLHASVQVVSMQARIELVHGLHGSLRCAEALLRKFDTGARRLIWSMLIKNSIKATRLYRLPRLCLSRKEVCPVPGPKLCSKAC